MGLASVGRQHPNIGTLEIALQSVSGKLATSQVYAGLEITRDRQPNASLGE
jgi:hypothetical protein